MLLSSHLKRPKESAGLDTELAARTVPDRGNSWCKRTEGGAWECIRGTTSGRAAGAKKVNGVQWEMKLERKEGTLSGAWFSLS